MLYKENIPSTLSFYNKQRHKMILKIKKDTNNKYVTFFGKTQH